MIGTQRDLFSAGLASRVRAMSGQRVGGIRAATDKRAAGMSYRRRGDKHQSSHSSRHTGVDDRLSALDIDPLVLGIRPNDVHLGSQMDDRLLTIDRGQHRIGIADVGQHLGQSQARRMPL